MLRLCGVFVVELIRLCRDDFVILRGDPAPNPGVGVVLVTSLNGDLSRRRDGVRYSMSWNAQYWTASVLTQCCYNN